VPAGRDVAVALALALGRALAAAVAVALGGAGVAVLVAGSVVDAAHETVVKITQTRRRTWVQW
jgi:hypothetical protein